MTISYVFGTLIIDGSTYTEDVVIDNGVVKPREKDRTAVLTGHRPLMITENIPWDCSQLVIGTGMHGAMPISQEVYEEAENRGVELLILRTPIIVDLIRMSAEDTNFVLHLTC